MTTNPLLTWAAQRLGGLPDVVTRPEFGNRTFYLRGTRFAAVAARTLVIHLPPTELTSALRAGLARPFVSVGAMGRNGWVEVQIERADESTLDRLIQASHAAARQAHRKAAPRRPNRARHVRRTPTER